MPQRVHEEITWDKKRIAILISLLFIVAAGFFAAKNFLFPNNNITTKTIAVEGAQSSIGHQTSLSLPSTQDVQKKMQEIQKQIEHINVDEIASSSPEIQQIIKQIQTLPQQPANIVRNACVQLCKNIK